MAAPASASSSRVLHVAPVASGEQDGSSWEDAGDLGDVPGFVRDAGPGGEVLLRTDRGEYPARTLLLRDGGEAGAPVTVRGVDPQGGDDAARAVLRGDRASPWRPGRRSGEEVFRLLAGADHLEFRDLDFRDVGNGCFRLAAGTTGLDVVDVSARNVTRFLENYASAPARRASARDVILSGVQVEDFSRSAVRLRYGTSGVVLRDVLGRAGATTEEFSMGVHLDERVSDVLLERVTMTASTTRTSGYWNGDGFAAERGTSDLRFRDTLAVDTGDAGYDLKASRVVLERAAARGATRSFRFWGSDVRGTDLMSASPAREGGTADTHHVWVARRAGPVELVGSRFSGLGPEHVGVYLQRGSRVRLSGTSWGTPTGEPSVRVERGAVLRGDGADR